MREKDIDIVKLIVEIMPEDSEIQSKDKRVYNMVCKLEKIYTPYFMCKKEETQNEKDKF